MKTPVPVPSIVLKLAVVGLGDVLQQTPRDVTAAPPSDEMSPPLIALLDVTVVATLVVASVGSTVVTLVVKLTSGA